MYYSIISLLFIFGGSALFGASTSTANLTTMSGGISASEHPDGGLFSIGVSVGRFILFVGFGVVIGADIPAWFAVLFAMWQTVMLIFTVGFIIKSVWDG